jgi:hypothetical protein
MTETYDQVITSEEQVASVKAALIAEKVALRTVAPFLRRRPTRGRRRKSPGSPAVGPRRSRITRVAS